VAADLPRGSDQHQALLCPWGHDWEFWAVCTPREAWGLDALPAHLRPTYRVVDESGREQARGKDLATLKAPLRPRFGVPVGLGKNRADMA